MLCQMCKKNSATIHYKSNINGTVSEKYLCAECAAKNGFGEKTNAMDMFNTMDMADNFFDNSADSFLGGLFGEMLEEKQTPTPIKTVCPGCGMRYGDFVHGGRMGCEKCYEAFESLLKPTLKRIHGNTRYCGKTPVGYGKKASVEEKIEALKEKLNKAVEAQEYEKAAGFRDEIRALEADKDKNDGEGKNND